jgi:flagellar basal body-associated protein FliL
MPSAVKTATRSQPSVQKGIAFSLCAIALAALGIGTWSTSGCERLSDDGGPQKSTLHLETFVLNLADPGQRSYLRVGIDLGLTHELTKEGAPVGQLRDTILGVLGEAKVDELVTARGKARLKEDLLRALQQRVPGLGVEEVYFTEFLIQR